MHEIIAHPIVAGAIAGVMTAAAVDLQAFRAFKSLDEATKYAWNLAAWRWFQGAVLGAVAAAGHTALLT